MVNDDFMRGYKVGMEDERIIWINAINNLKTSENEDFIKTIFGKAGVDDVD